MRRVATRSVVALLAFAVLGAGSTAASAAGSPAYVAEILTARGRFRAVIRDPAMVEKAKREVAGGEEAGIPYGPLAWGDGGVNRGHAWHVTELRFADVTIELCDGTVRDVDQNPAYWVETVRSFCPWSGEVLFLRPARPGEA